MNDENGNRYSIKIPYSVFIAFFAVNMTAVAVLLQFNFFVSQSHLAKSIAWVVSAAAWILAYAYRNKFYRLRVR